MGGWKADPRQRLIDYTLVYNEVQFQKNEGRGDWDGGKKKSIWVSITDLECDWLFNLAWSSCEGYRHGFPTG